MEGTTWSLNFREDSFWPALTPFVILSENTTRLYSLKNSILRQFYFTENGLGTLLDTNEEYSSNQLRHVFSIAVNKDLLIATLEHGLRMYIWDDQVVTKVLDIKTRINWNWGETDIDIGRFFENWSRMGAVVTLPQKKVKIFELTISNEGNYTWEFLKFFPNITTEFCPTWSNMMLGNLKKNPKQMLITEGDNGLCVFELNENTDIEIVMEIPYPQNEGITRNDRIFFANLSGDDHWMDMIVFNAAGLFLFDYQSEPKPLYKLFNYNSMFSKQKGWKDKHTETVRFIDVNNDGFDDMIFTGPAGIEILSFDIFTKKWKSLLSRKMLTPQENLSIVLHALPQVKGNVSNVALVTYQSGAIGRADIIEIPTKRMSNVPVNSKVPLLLEKSALVPNSYMKHKDSRSILYLRDENILLLTSESVNPQTGKPHFVLPLIRSADSLIKFNLLYNAGNTGNEPLGMGWSTQQSFIIANYNDANFEEDEYYVLVVENIPHRLHLLSTTSNSFLFEIENGEHEMQKEKIQVTYFPSMSVWEIDFGSGRKQIYGGYINEQFGAIISDKAWTNWRGLGRDKTGLVERDNTWYLATSEFKNETTYYEYEVIKVRKNSTQDSYISGIFVKKIHNSLSELTFFYSNNDEIKNLPFHLTGYNYKTKSKEQTIHFRYQMIENFFSLVAIEQASDYIAKPVVKFQYCEPIKGNYVLEKIILSTGVEIVYNYTRLEKEEPANGDDDFQKVPVSDDYNVSYGPGFILVSYIDKNEKKVILRMFTNTLSEEIYPSNSNSWPSLGNSIEVYEILLGDDFFAVVVYSVQSKSVYLFGRKADGNWVDSDLYNYSDESTILKGNNFIVVSDPKLTNINVHEWIQEGMIWQNFTLTANSIHRSIAVHGKKFVLYDNHHLRLFYRKPRKYSQWTFAYLKDVPGRLSCTSEILEKFDLEKDFEKSIYGFFRQNSLQFRNNIVVLSSLHFKYGHRLYTKLNIYSIGRNLSIVTEGYKIVNQDSFFNFESKAKSHLGYLFTLKYAYEQDKFKLVLGTYISSENISQIDFIENEIREMNSPAEHFLLDLKDYHITLSDQIIKCYDDIFFFGGTDWHFIQNKATLTSSYYQPIKLGDRFIVSKTDIESTIKLYDATNNESLFDFGVWNLNQLRINYPIYIASQGENKSVIVLEFQDGKEAKYTSRILRYDSELSPFGNAHLLVTHQTDTKSGNKTVLLWNMYGLHRFLPSFMLNSVKTIFHGETGGSKERVIGYEYLETDAQLTPNGIQYSRVSVLPGNKSSIYGYFAITQSYVQYYNGRGNLIKTIQKENKQNSRESRPNEEKEKDTILYSRDGLLEIAHFSPFSVSSDMCSFIGFEEYEEISLLWDFKTEDIVSGGFSLTGKNFLHLNNSSIKGLFFPEFPDRTFVVTCWIRTTIENISTPGKIVPYLTAAVLTDRGDVILTFLADVKYQIGDWLYLEVIIDLEFIRLVLEKAHNFRTDQPQIEIQISSINDSPIDVDHIRFGPLINIFDVNVYDGELNTQIAIIKSNGAILRWIYDRYELQIAEINESNQIAEFNTYTKQSYKGERFRNPICVVKLIPENGFHEMFSPISFHTRWTLTHVGNWDISPGKLRHHTSTESSLLLTSGDIDTISYGIRFLYQLTKESRIVISNIVKMCYGRDETTISISKDVSSKQKINTEGEILLVQEGRRVIVWLDGGLYFDLSLDFCRSLSIAVEGDVTFQDMMVFGRPKFQVTYKNALNEEIQQISVISDSVAIVKEILYDELGRPRITTQLTEISRNEGQSIVAYISDFVTNDDDTSAPDSVWKSGKMFGEIKTINGHDYAFNEIVYEDNPLNIQTLIGLPGEEFSRNGSFVRRFNSTTSNVLVQKLFPLSENYTYHVQYEMCGDEKISVFDKENNEVATYIHTEHGRDILATFRYNKRGLLVRFRPPKLYSKIGILNETNSDQINILIKDEGEDPLETCIEYDAKDNPQRKTTPDMGPLENIYDENGRLRFSIQFVRNKRTDIKSVTYYRYDVHGRPVTTGILKEPLPKKAQLLALTISNENSDQFQHFLYSDSESDPALRQRILRSITKYHDKLLYEESILDVNNKVISKRIVYPNGSDKPEILAINKGYEGDLLKRLIYPAYVLGDLFQVVYEYDKSGRMIAVGIPGQRDFFITIKYNVNDQIREEVFLPSDQNEFTRKYEYNKPGFLVKIDDKFLSQDISYTEKGYGKNVYGDGRVSRIKFSAKWHEFANSDELGLRENSFIDEQHSLEDSKKCFRKLKSGYYLDHNNKQVRIFYQIFDPKISLACPIAGGKLNQILGKYGFPREYGYRFDYGFRMELEKAKYFVGNEEQEPEAFQSNTLAKNVPYINYDQSKNIWLKLKSKGYISENSKGYGTLNIHSIVRESLNNDLTSLNGSFSSYTQVISMLLIKYYAEQVSNNPNIGKIFVQEFLHLTPDAKKIKQMLIRRNYFQDPFNSEFKNILKDFKIYIPEIVAVLLRSFGRAEFDMEFEEIDPNGNHIKFMSNFHKYILEYESDSNRINQIQFLKNGNEQLLEIFNVQHDDRGNVIQAEHKGIKSMEYHVVSNRLEKAELENGNTIRLSYDSKGERAFKQVINREGETLSENYYLRDENGRTLVERLFSFMRRDQPPDVLVTIYIYGPKSLIGFIRRNQFYSVITDHQNSIRLIVRDGVVVAAYDYMPYGSFMRVFESDPNAIIPYRFTGQEWDSELDLYNFHARIYDPLIGRFFQIDPLTQYFNPYEYAGNSPVSMVDPSGLVAFLLPAAIVGFALLGAYLAGVASNNNDYNILNWNWSSRKTQMAIFMGGVTGALIPMGFSGSLSVLSMMMSTFKAAAVVKSIGITIAYINVAAQQENLNPGNWDYSPEMWNAAFEGFSMGVGILSSFHGAYKTFITLSRRSKYVFGTFVAFFGTQSSIMSDTKLSDIDKPSFWISAISSAQFASDVPQIMTRGFRFIRKYHEIIYQNLRNLAKSVFRVVLGYRRHKLPQYFTIELGAQFRQISKQGRQFLVYMKTFALSNHLMLGYIALSNLTELSTYHQIINAGITSTELLDSAKIVAKGKIPKRTIILATLLADILREPLKILRMRLFRRSTESDFQLLINDPFLSVNGSKITLIYAKNEMIHPFFFNRNPNETIGGNRNEPGEEIKMAGEIIAFAPEIEKSLRRKYKENLFRVNISDWKIDNRTLKDIFDEKITKLVEKNVYEIVEKDEYINWEMIFSSLDRKIFEGKRINNLSNKYANKKNKLLQLNSTLSKNLDFMERNKLLSKSKYLEIAINNLKKRQLYEIDYQKYTLSESLWERINEFQNSWLSWKVSNLCEPPLIMLPSIKEQLPFKHLPIQNAYQSTDDVKFLSSYKLQDIPELTVFQKCYNCLNSTMRTGLLVRDIAWSMLLNPNETSDMNKQDAKIRKLRSVDSRSVNDELFPNLFGKVKEKCQRIWKTLITRNNERQQNVQKSTILQFSSPSIAENQRNHQNSSWNFTELGDELFTAIATNDSLLLSEIFLAKYLKRKINLPSKRFPISNFTQKLEFACEIIEIYEESIQLSAKASGIKLNRLRINNIPELYEQIISTYAKAKQLEKLICFLTESALEALPSSKVGEHGHLSARKRKLFERKFNRTLKEKINKIFIKMNGLTGEI